MTNKAGIENLYQKNPALSPEIRETLFQYIEILKFDEIQSGTNLFNSEY